MTPEERLPLTYKIEDYLPGPGGFRESGEIVNVCEETNGYYLLLTTTRDRLGILNTSTSSYDEVKLKFSER